MAGDGSLLFGYGGLPVMGQWHRGVGGELKKRWPGASVVRFLSASFFCLKLYIGYAIYTGMHAKSSSHADAQTRWLDEVARLWPVAKGSLSEVRKPCTRSNCPACRDGRRHRVFLFCYREDGRSRAPGRQVAVDVPVGGPRLGHGRLDPGHCRSQ